MSWFDCTLSHRMRNKEEIKSTIDNLGLFNKPIVNICSLWWVGDGSVRVGHLEESLSYSLVHNNESVLWMLLILICIKTILLSNNLLELLKLMVNDLLSHRIANTITIDEDVIGKGAIMITEGLESTLEVSLKNTRADDFLSFLTLRASLCVIFTHVLIIGSTETDDTLLSFMTYVNTNKHRLP